MSRVLVIGFGNAMRGDDGLGWHAAQKLLHAGLGDGVHVLPCRQLTPELAAEVAAAGFVLFIDVACDLPVGEVDCIDVECVHDRPSFCLHRLNPSGLLALARDVYGEYPPAVALVAGAESFECGAPLSPPAAAALVRVVEQARRIIAHRLAVAPCPG